MESSNKLIYNTIVLYSQLIVNMLIGIFTVRVVLDALGEVNYGIYTLVAGVVGILGILNSNMANTSMRYMSHSLGTNDRDASLITFNTTLILHFVIGAIVIVVMEIAGFFMFEYMLNIPADRVFDAKVVFHFMVVTTFFTVIAVPYDAVINSHENMSLLAKVSIFGSFLNLVVAISLIYYKGNLLILYGFLLMLIQIVLRGIKQWYSNKHYPECKVNFRKHVNIDKGKEILSFTGWDLLGSLSALAVGQIRALLINMFFGVRLNASTGVTSNFCGKINLVAVSIGQAINPRIIKSEGGGNRERMLKLTGTSAKFSAVMFSAFAVPIILDASFLLNLWLKDVPEYAVIFSQLLLINMLIEKFSFPITTAIRAAGEIKSFRIVESILYLVQIPIAYMLFKHGGNPSSIYTIGIYMAILIFIERLYFGKRLVGLVIWNYIRDYVLTVFIPLLISIVLVLITFYLLPVSIWRFALIFSQFSIVLTGLFWMMGMTISEKNVIKNLFVSLSDKAKNKF